MVNIELSRDRIFIWEPVNVKISGLEPGQRVRLNAGTFTTKGVYHESDVEFIADEKGEVNTETSAAESGSYQGVDAMGIFWSMKAKYADKSKEVAHYMPETVILTAYVDGIEKARAELVRMNMADNVTITPVKGNGMFAEYYAPNGKIQKNNIISFGGSDGTIYSGRRLARFLSSHGFGVLAMAYFLEEGLPDRLVSIPIESVGRAIEWIKANCSKDGKIGITGISRGGEFSLLTASYYSDINCVAALTPATLMWESEDISGCYPSWSVNGKDLPFIECDYDQELRDIQKEDKEFFECTSTYVRCLDDAEKNREDFLEECTIKVENINGNILMVSGKEDLVWPAYRMCCKAMRRLDEKGFKHKYQHITYEHVGHRVYTDGYVSTLPDYIMNTGSKMHLGGDPKYNAHAQANTRKALLEFFAENLKE